MVSLFMNELYCVEVGLDTCICDGWLVNGGGLVLLTVFGWVVMLGVGRFLPVALFCSRSWC